MLKRLVANTVLTLLGLFFTWTITLANTTCTVNFISQHSFSKKLAQNQLESGIDKTHFKNTSIDFNLFEKEIDEEEKEEDEDEDDVFAKSQASDHYYNLCSTDFNLSYLLKYNLNNLAFHKCIPCSQSHRLHLVVGSLQI